MAHLHSLTEKINATTEAVQTEDNSDSRSVTWLLYCLYAAPAVSIYLHLMLPLRTRLLWSSVTPVCAVQQRRHYLVAPGGAVTVSCQVDAYPTSLTFTWALKNDSERSPIQLHSVGREEGLTGHYTLRGVNQKSVEVLCSAQNDVGTQITPCKMTVYTEGRPGPVRNCSVNSHTASGYRVICEAGLPRGTNTQYTLLKGSEERSNSVSGDNNNDDLGNGRGGHASVSPILDKLLRNLTSSSPVFLVSGLRAGREFVLVVRAAGDEGVSPPVVLTAFTLTDNAQTVIGE
ncbi:hypothetical protein E2C01_037864 [Portunus trituberculatus]|uniref:Ig-like domain-containing protein n=1 Tax=Portunus trituberculatus TaxID=210409 RepID=A0A5B7FGZ0_PORTR|nr:hypothetical protein [Portunus trituberculatus]